MNDENFQRSAMEPVTMVPAVSMKTSWKNHSDMTPTSYELPARNQPLVPNIPQSSPPNVTMPSRTPDPPRVPIPGPPIELIPPNINANPVKNQPTPATAKMTKFIIIVWAAFLARVNPVSTSANPDWKKSTSAPASSVQVKLTDILFLPTWSATVANVSLSNFAGDSPVTSVELPVLSPQGSPSRSAFPPQAGTGVGSGESA